MDLPIGMGDEARQTYYHTTAETLIKHDLGQPKTAMQGADAKTSMDWDNDATEMLMDEAMRRAGNNQGIAAALLGITRQTLNRRLQSKKR